MSMTRRCLAMLIIFFLPLKLFAWDALGHMVVANIAYQHMKPSTRARVDAIVQNLTAEYPEYRSFKQMAYWPDAIREQHIETFTHWHYIDHAFSTDGSPLKNLIDTDNALWAYMGVAVVVKNTKANKFERARFLAFLTHITGDLHQPLHTVSNITAKHPDGDKGGNLYYVSNKGSRMNLHRVWDGGVGIFEGPSSDARVDEITKEITTKYPPAYFNNKDTDLDPENWVKESSDVAKKDAYTTPEDKAMSESYLVNGREVAEEQAALAGYRLANVLNQLLA